MGATTISQPELSPDETDGRVTEKQMKNTEPTKDLCLFTRLLCAERVYRGCVDEKWAIVSPVSYHNTGGLGT